MVINSNTLNETERRILSIFRNLQSDVISTAKAITQAKEALSEGRSNGVSKEEVTLIIGDTVYPPKGEPYTETEEERAEKKAQAEVNESEFRKVINTLLLNIENKLRAGTLTKKKALSEKEFLQYIIKAYRGADMEEEEVILSFS